MSGILARIRALFAPTRGAAQPPGQNEAAVPVPPPTEPAPPPTVSEPIAAVDERSPTLAVDEPSPAVVVEEPAAAAAAPPPPEIAPPIVETPARPRRTLSVPPSGGLMLRLEAERGSRSTFEVTRSGATIGRGAESTIQLADLSVSRKHAKITYRQGAYWVSDLGSMGGTWIDGTKLTGPRRVAPGQTIDIGLCRLTVVSAEAEQEEEAPAEEGPTHAT